MNRKEMVVYNSLHGHPGSGKYKTSDGIILNVTDWDASTDDKSVSKAT